MSEKTQEILGLKAQEGFEKGSECGTGTPGRGFLLEGLGKDKSQAGKTEEGEGMSLNM